VAAGGQTSRVRARVPGRGRMLGAVVMVVLGSFMPWVATAVGSVSGARGAGLWTFYAAMLGLAAVLVPVRSLRIVQGAVFAVVAIALPVWQLVHLYTLIGFGGWRPGPGLVLVLFGGILAAVAVRQMIRPPAE
jgi:hypothetical protein